MIEKATPNRYSRESARRGRPVKNFIEEAYKMHGIHYCSYQDQPKIQEIFPNMCQYAGFCYCLDGKPYIFVDEARGQNKVQSVKAHEMGHVLLGHLDPNENLESEATEKEADIFGVVMYALSLYDEYLQRNRSGEHG